MASDLAVGVRDRLNGMIEELLTEKDSQEANVLACCIAIAIEEIEKWMYHGTMTPSVIPVVDGKPISISVGDKGESVPVPNEVMPFPEPFPDPVDQDSWKAIKSRASAFKRVQLKAGTLKAAGKVFGVKTPSVLDKYEPGDWDDAMMKAFRDGNRAVFIAYVQAMIPGIHISLNAASDYTSRMAKAYPHLWASNTPKPPHQSGV